MRSNKDEFEGFSAPGNEVSRDALVECSQFALLMSGKSQQIGIGDLSMGNDGVRFENLKQTDIFCPEAVAWRLTKQTQDSQYSRNIPWSVRVARMAGDAYETIFGNRTGRPDPSVLFSKPAMGGFMMDVHRISQGKKQIDVQKIGRQGVSSRRRLTSSGVTKPALGWTGNSGRPSFVVTGACRVMDCRARSESTRPTVVPRCLASSLAAKRTSSSRSIVVRIVF